MFRKPFVSGLRCKVSGADRKKLRRALGQQLGIGDAAAQGGGGGGSGGAADEGAAALDAVLPLKAGDLEQAKLSAPARGAVYNHDGVPVLFDASGKGDRYVPTVMALWRAPELLPRVQLKHPAVSQFIVGAAHGRHGHGADVMLPGVNTEGLPPFRKGDLVAVVVPGNPAPIAVGVATLSAEDARAAGRAASKGKAVEVLQAYGDYLYAEVPGRPVPNEGFLETSVGPLPGFADGGGSDDGGEGGAATGPPHEDAAAAADADDSSMVAGPAGAAEAVEPSVDMESLLEAALLQALHKSVKDRDLPMAGSALWAQHILPSRPPGSTLDVKKSKHRKTLKWLQMYAKAGLLSGKEDKAGDFVVTAINRGHSLYAEYRPFKAAAAAGAGEGGGGQGDGGLSAELLIEEVFKPTREVKPIFEAVGAAVDALYSGPEAFEVAQAYVKAAKLEEGAPDNRTLLLDAALCDALFKGVVKKGEIFPTTLPKAVLREKFLARMQPQVVVQRGGTRAVRKGALPLVHVSAEKRQGNKRVTRIAGLEAYLVDVEACAAELRSKLACSTSVSELPGKNNPGHEVLVQGGVVDRVAEHLVGVYGIPKKSILTKTV